MSNTVDVNLTLVAFHATRNQDL